MKIKKEVYRVGDKIKIKTPEFFERVGYPLTLQKVEEEHFSKDEKLRINEFLTSFEIFQGDFFRSRKDPTYDLILRLLAKYRIRQLGWGGRKKSIYTVTKQVSPDTVYKVIKKRVVKTGTYHHASGGYDYWGEYDYEPASLDDQKTHILLGVAQENYIFCVDEIEWIEDINVEKIWDEA